MVTSTVREVQIISNRYGASLMSKWMKIFQNSKTGCPTTAWRGWDGNRSSPVFQSPLHFPFSLHLTPFVHLSHAWILTGVRLCTSLWCGCQCSYSRGCGAGSGWRWDWPCRLDWRGLWMPHKGVCTLEVMVLTGVLAPSLHLASWHHWEWWELFFWECAVHESGWGWFSCCRMAVEQLKTKVVSNREPQNSGGLGRTWAHL